MQETLIGDLIENIDKLPTKADIEALGKWSKDMPWFSAPHLLMAKMLHNEGSVYFDKYLKKAAAYVGERETLYALVHGEIPSSNSYTHDISLEEVEQLQEPQFQEQVDSLVERTNEDTLSTGWGEEEREGEVSQEEDKLLESTPLEDREQVQEERVLVENPDEVQPQEEEIEELVEDDSMMATTPIPMESEPIVTDSEQVVMDVISEPQVVQPELKQTTLPEAVPQVISVNPSPPSLKSFQSAEARPYSTWLRDIKQGTAFTPQLQTAQLIDAFLEKPGSNLRIRVAVKEENEARFYNAEEMAEASTVEDHSLATLTLADIYENQGLYERAIEVYERLEAKEPLRSAYFASHIERLQALPPLE